MAIDRIGKGGGAGVPPTTTNDAGGVARPQEASRPFEAQRSERPEKAGATLPPGAIAPTAAAPLDALRAGKVDLRGYLDMKVEEATSHLHGLRPADLDQIKQTLREQMASDPALVDLVKQATGHAPEPPRND